MTLNAVLFAVVLVVALAFFARSAARLIGYLRLGKKEDRFAEPGRRLGRVITVAFGQSKLLREPFAGLLHFLIFWGFVVLLSSVLESIGEGLAPGFSFAFLGPLYRPLQTLIDLFGALVVAAVVVSIVRRIAAPPPRLRVTGHAKWDAILILSLILLVMVTMFGQNAARIASGVPAGGRFIASALAGAFAPDAAGAWFLVFFWGHMLSVLAFLNYLPYSKHLHVLSSIPNVYFSSLGPRGALAPV